MNRTNGLDLKKPHKFDHGKRIVIASQSVEFAQDEYDILMMYCNGMSVNAIRIETNCEFVTIVSVIRRGLSMFMKKGNV